MIRMKTYGKSRRLRRDKWANRMALLGITLVVACLAVVITATGASRRRMDLEYKVRQENLQAQLEAESKRAEELEDYKVYVKTKEYAEEVVKEKLGLVNPDEILLKPSE